MKATFRFLPLAALLVLGAAQATPVTARAQAALLYPYVQDPYQTGYNEAISWGSQQSQQAVSEELEKAYRMRDEIDGSQPNSINQY